MADKLNLEGFSVSTNDVCTADGGFVGVTGGVVTSYSYGEGPAINVSSHLVKLQSGASGNTVLTLADGVSGQRMTLLCTSRLINDSVVTVANLQAVGVSAPNTLTFDASGELCELIFDGTSWQAHSYTCTITQV